MNTKIGGGGCGMPRGARQSVRWGWRSTYAVRLTFFLSHAHRLTEIYICHLLQKVGHKWTIERSGEPPSPPRFPPPFRKSKTEIELKLKWSKREQQSEKAFDCMLFLGMHYEMNISFDGRGRDQLWAWQRDVRMRRPAFHTNKLGNKREREREQWRSVCLEVSVF